MQVRARYGGNNGLTIDPTLQMNVIQRGQVSAVHRTMVFSVCEPVQDPLVPFFKDDLEVMHIRSDPSRLKMGYVKSMLSFVAFCPCFLPHIFMVCAPCSICLLQGALEDSSKANHLILREKSLLYRMDQTALPVVSPKDPIVPICAAAMRVMSQPLELVVPLDKCTVEHVPATNGACLNMFGNYPVDTIVVKSEGTFVCAIDAPEDAEKFIAKVQEQIAKVQSMNISSSIPFELMTVHRTAIRLLAPLPTMAFLDANPQMRQGMLGLLQAEMQPQLNLYRDQLRLWQESQQQQGSTSMPHAVPVPSSSSSQGGLSSVPLVAEIVRDSAPTISTIQSMTVQDVCRLLGELGLSENAPAFEKGGVDGSVLSVIDDETLKELGVASALSRKKILGWVKAKEQAYSRNQLTMT